MKNVMVDNWLLDDIVSKANAREFPESLSVLLAALVLWDNVYYPMNSASYWKEVNVEKSKWQREIESLQEAVCFFDDNNEAFDVEQRLFFTNNRDLFDEDTTAVVAVGALRYLSLSNSRGLDYLPCAQRRQFIAKYPNVCKTVIDRIDTLRPLDKEVKEFINDLNKEYDSNFLSIKAPILTKYIRDNTPEDMSHVEFALHLRHEGPVVQYRRYLDEVENAINHQNIRELIRLGEYSKEIVRDIVNSDDTIISAQYNILPMPGISVSKSTNISKKLHLTFLKELVNNAINGALRK